MNERVLSFDARHRDVVGDCERRTGKAPTLFDVVCNMIDNYSSAHSIWERRVHHNWGLFKSLWPASVLLDVRLDRQDPETWEWIKVFGVLGGGCSIVCLLSLYLLFFRMLF